MEKNKKYSALKRDSSRGAGLPGRGTPGGVTPGTGTMGAGKPGGVTTRTGIMGAGTPVGVTPRAGTPGKGTPGKGTPGDVFHRRMWLLPVVFLLVFTGCYEEIDWEPGESGEKRLVVDALITNEAMAHAVKLSTTFSGIDGDPEPVTGAEVMLTDGEQVEMLTESEGEPGTYFTGEDVRAVVNKQYGLRIRYAGEETWGVARMEAVTPIRYPRFYRVSDDPELYEFWLPGSDGPAIMELELDWSGVEGYEGLPAAETHAVVKEYFFSALTVDVNEIFSADRDRLRIPPGTGVVISKYSMSDGYAEYLRGMLSETSWNGGMFDVKAGNPLSNLTNGAVGYFAVCTVVRDTMIFHPGMMQ